MLSSDNFIQQLLEQIPTAHPFAGLTLRSMQTIQGGCINQALRLETNHGRVFLKINTLDFAPNFSAEANGLKLLAPHVRVPRHAISGVVNQQAFLLMEYVDIASPKSGYRTDDTLGEQIAQLHIHTASAFGLDHDNFIGATAQHNTWEKNWPTFFAHYRLKPQLDRAISRGLPQSTHESAYRLINEIQHFFSNYTPAASLIHGDLWGANHGFLPDGTLVLFDPAVYFADREAELAMTELFGGFSSRAHQAYSSAWPLDPGYAQRKNLYNLYHVLNHFNLFGGGYGQKAQRIIHKLLSLL